MADWKKIVLATGTSTQYIKGDGTFATYTDSLPLVGGTVTGDVIIKNNNGNASQTLLILRNNDNTSNTETGQTAELEFQFKGTTDSGVSFDTKNAGKIVAGKDTDYFTASADNMDSHLKFYTSQDNVNTLALTIDSSQNVGIGETSPNTKLSLKGSQGAFDFTRGNTNDSHWFFSSDSARLYISETDIQSSNIKVTIDDSGNVGIGTVPTAKLDINISSNARGYFSSTIGEVGSGNFALQAVDSSGANLKPLGFRAEDIRFATGSAERLRINSSGNTEIYGNIEQSINSNGGNLNEFRNTNTGTSAYSEHRIVMGADNTGLRLGSSYNYSNADWNNAWVYAVARDLKLASSNGKMDFYVNGSTASDIALTIATDKEATFADDVRLGISKKIYGQSNSTNSIEFYNGATGAMNFVSGTASYDYPMEFRQNDAQVMTIKSQRVGIGTQSPAQGQSTPISDIKLDVAGNQMLSDLSTTNTDQSKLFFFRSDGAVGSQGQVPSGLKIGAIEWTALTNADDNNSISSARIEAEASNVWDSASNRNADIIFSTVGSNTLTEAMRIDSSQNVTFADKLNLHKANGTGLTSYIGIRDSGTSSVRSGLGLGTADSTLVLYVDKNNAIGSGSALVLQTGGTDALTINGSQNVAIGSSGSGYRLDVRGTSGTLFSQTTATSGSMARLRANNGSTSVLQINADGNIGMGTESPSSYHSQAHNLVIYENSNSGMTIASANNASGSIFFADSTTGDEAYKGRIEYNHGTNKLQFGANSVIHTTLDASGNFGIGSSSPSGVLEVNTGSGAMYITRTAGDDGSANPAIAFLTDSAKSRMYSYGDLSFYTTTVGGTISQKMKLDSSGQLGLGTTSPNSLLEVSGTSAIRSTYTGTSSAGVGGALQLVQDDGFAIESGHRIGYVVFGASEDSSNTIHYGGSINAFATETYSASGNGTKLTFDVTANGATSRSTALTLDQDKDATFAGNVVVNGRIEKTGELYINPTTNLRLRGNVITFGNAGGTSEFARFDSSGRLGVGVSPTTILNIKSAQPILKLEDTTAYNSSPRNRIEFRNIFNADTVQHPAGYIDMFSSNSTAGNYETHMAFTTRTASSGLVEAMRIDSNQRVGINTTNPSDYLHVVGAIKAQDGSSSVDYVRMYHDGTDGYLISNRGQLRLSSQSGIDALKIDSSGNVSLSNNLSLTNGSPVMYMSGSGGDHTRFGWTEGDPDVAYWRFYQNGGMTASITMDAFTENTAGGRIEFNTGASEVAIASIDSGGMTLNGALTVNENALTLEEDIGFNASYVRMKYNMLNSTDDAYGTVGMQRTASTTYLGMLISSDSRDGIRFSTANGTPVERMRIDASGRVGIGVDSPTKTLELNGSYKLGSNAFINYNATYPYTINVENTAGVGNLTFQAGTGSTGFKSKIELQGGNTATDASITLTTADTARMTILNNGNVGIGTSSPSHLLHVDAGSGNAGVLIQSTSNTGAAELDLRSGDQSWSLSHQTDGDLVIYDRTRSAEVVSFKSGSGNVGIGTDSPSQLLTISNSSDTNKTKLAIVGGTKGFTIGKTFQSQSYGHIRPISSGQVMALRLMPNTTDQDTYLELFGHDYETETTNFARGMLILKQSDGNAFQIVSDANGSESVGNIEFVIENGSTPAVVIDTNGRMGIGNTAPDKTLVVQGSGAEAVISDTGTIPTLRFREGGATKGVVRTSSGTMQLYSNGSASSNLAMTIDSSQRVGIQQSSPTEALHVKGNIKASGELIGKTYVTFVHNFSDDMGTSAHTIPWTDGNEAPDNSKANTNFVAPYPMSLVKIIVRPTAVQNSGALRVTLKKEDDGDGTNDTVATATPSGNLASNTAKVVTASDFDNTPDIGILDKINIELSTSVDVNTSSTDWFVTTVWTMDVN